MSAGSGGEGAWHNDVHMQTPDTLVHSTHFTHMLHPTTSGDIQASSNSRPEDIGKGARNGKLAHMLRQLHLELIELGEPPKPQTSLHRGPRRPRGARRLTQGRKFRS